MSETFAQYRDAAMAALQQQQTADDAAVLAVVALNSRRRLGTESIARRCPSLTLERVDSALERLRLTGYVLRIQCRGNRFVTWEAVRSSQTTR